MSKKPTVIEVLSSEELMKAPLKKVEEINNLVWNYFKIVEAVKTIKKVEEIQK